MNFYNNPEFFEVFSLCLNNIFEFKNIFPDTYYWKNDVFNLNQYLQIKRGLLKYCKKISHHLIKSVTVNGCILYQYDSEDEKNYRLFYGQND